MPGSTSTLLSGQDALRVSGRLSEVVLGEGTQERPPPDPCPPGAPLKPKKAAGGPHRSQRPLQRVHRGPFSPPLCALPISSNLHLGPRLASRELAMKGVAWPQSSKPQEHQFTEISRGRKLLSGEVNKDSGCQKIQRIVMIVFMILLPIALLIQ